ncbi:MAG: sugar transferase [Candidatus Omnitrophica bacterium]|nr:sugar transferase [Candidatus Omnitrophota bacterium]MBU4488719.1 sugar transferase [Candidatus Omnitrophota bacterium]MCG2705748.1 sugar transferase [Candidatus Omnitrophota bacterium]
MKRIFDLITALLLLACLSLPLLAIAVIIKLTSAGPVLYWSDRVGKDNKIFKMCKFRTMRIDTPVVATHLFKDADRYVTPIGSFLRRFSLDELPQLFNIISGDMTFVGPRPALFNQDDLIELRSRKNVHSLTPGVTGWAQINGRDKLPIPIKVEFDEYYLKNKSLLLDIKIIFITLLKVIKREGVKY